MLACVRVYLATLGCKLNESELEAWARQFARAGHQVVAEVRAADVCILNTCAITHVAARKSRQLARQLARVNPRARLVLTGCYATLAPEQMRAFGNPTLVVPNAEKERLVERISDFGCEPPSAYPAVRRSPTVLDDECAASPGLDAEVETQVAGGEPQFVLSALGHSPHFRTRAFVKIQDGCNMSCAYCVIPLARGRERSRPLDEIVAEVRARVDAGYNEIVLTGVQISAYRSPNLREVIRALLAQTAVPRLRLSSVAPWDMDASLLDLFDEARVCRHLHLSLQSGSDAVLRRMRRPYTTAQFARAVNRAREKIPDIGITTDVIVGFPGESDAEFAESLAFVERMRFARVHVFPYSLRAGTAAATMPAQVPERMKAARARQMQVVASASARAFAQRFVGRTMEVLWETQELTADGRAPKVDKWRRGWWSGYTDNYIRVIAPSDADWSNRIAPARLVAVTDDGVVANFENL